MKKRVVLGFSGGVDSAVSAILLKESGYEVHGLYLDTGSAENIENVIKAANKIEMPINIADVKDRLNDLVCKPFAAAYAAGKTPNPCIVCNPEVKFNALLREADRLCCEHIASGHYARAVNGQLFKGQAQNDQSYLLCRIKKEQLVRLILPLGDYNKEEARKIAREHSLDSADKPASMEICFIPAGDHAAYIENLGIVPKPGRIMFEGRQVGEHDGIHKFTIGQRRHANIAAGERIYVSEINAETGDVIMGRLHDLMSNRLYVNEIKYLANPPEAESRCSVRIRHSKQSYEAKLIPMRADSGIVIFTEPARAATPGQTAAFYDGDRVIGGGLIEKAYKLDREN